MALSNLLVRVHKCPSGPPIHCSSQCGPQTTRSSSLGSLLEMQNLGPVVPDLLNQDMHVNKIPREFKSTFKFEKNC